MTSWRAELAERVADALEARMGPLVGSPEYLADPVKRELAEKRRRDAAVGQASTALSIATPAILERAAEPLQRRLDQLADPHSSVAAVLRDQITAIRSLKDNPDVKA